MIFLWVVCVFYSFRFVLTLFFFMWIVFSLMSVTLCLATILIVYIVSTALHGHKIQIHIPVHASLVTHS
jgi:hypothetical protein